MSSSNGFQKSPKVAQHIKQMKIGAPPGTSHNVRIMLVGNNGKPGQQTYKANIADLKGLQYAQQSNGFQPPKSTKNSSKFYS